MELPEIYIERPEPFPFENVQHGPSLWLSGAATFKALKHAVDELCRLAPDDSDVVILVGDLTVLDARFIEPHTFSFEGRNQDGHPAWTIIHFSQLHARIVYRPKCGPHRVITGFGK